MSEQSITVEQLILYAVGEMAPSETAATQRHLAGSPQAAAYVAKVRAVLQTMRTDETEAPSVAVIKRAISAFSGGGESQGSLAWLEQLRRRVAKLMFDSRAQPALAGFRGGSSSYQLAYHSDLGRVELRVSPPQRPAQHAWRVRGQVTAGQRDGGELGSVALLTPGTSHALAVVELDQHGRFKFDTQCGRYDLAVQFGAEALIAPNLEIG